MTRASLTQNGCVWREQTASEVMEASIQVVGVGIIIRVRMRQMNTQSFRV